MFYGENLSFDVEPLAMLGEGMVKVGDEWLNEDQLPQGMRKTPGDLRGMKPKLKIGSPGRLVDWYHWPNNVLTFQFSTKFGEWEKYHIRRTLALLERKLDSCVRFQESWFALDAVKVRRGDGCSSVVGYQGGIGKYQDLSLGSKCWLDPGTIEHEFLHALGMFHTQNRFDRDKFIEIIWQNVIGGEGNTNFWKHSPIEANYFGLPYDYLSVMHYREKDASKNGGVTIKTRDHRYQNQGGRGWLAFGDRSRIPQSFRRARICKFSRQKRRFL